MAITQTTIDLAWTPATDNIQVAGYKVYNDDGDLIIADVGNVLNYTVENLNPDVEYSFYHRAYDHANNLSVKSNVVTARTLP